MPIEGPLKELDIHDVFLDACKATPGVTLRTARGALSLISG